MSQINRRSNNIVLEDVSSAMDTQEGPQFKKLDNKISVNQVLDLDIDALKELLEQALTTVSKPFGHQNKTGLILFKPKYINNVKVNGPGPRTTAIMNARIQEHSFVFQWHIKTNYKNEINYSRCFGSTLSVIDFYVHHYSKYEIIERNGFEYFYDTLRVCAAFDIEKYTPFVEGMDTNISDKEVYDAATEAIYGTLGYRPQYGCLLCTPAHRLVQIDGHPGQYWKTSFHFKHTGLKFPSVFQQKSFAHACVQYAKDNNIVNFFYKKPNSVGVPTDNNQYAQYKFREFFKENESILDLSLYRHEGEFRMYGSCKNGQINSCLLNPKYPVMNILIFIAHLYGDYITHEQARLYQHECNLSDTELLLLFPQQWDELKYH